MLWFLLRCDLLRLFPFPCGLLYFLFLLNVIFLFFVWGLCDHVSLNNNPPLVWLRIIFDKSLRLNCYSPPHIKQPQNSDKIILLIVWVIYTCFRVSISFYTLVAFIFSDCRFCLWQLLEVWIHCWSCGGGGRHCEVVTFLSTCPPWVNDTDPLFVDFNKAQSFFI